MSSIVWGSTGGIERWRSTHVEGARQAPGGHCPPRRWGVLAIVNAFSLDAVAVGLVWQSWVAMEYRGVSATAYEAVVLGMTIWLIYTLDRLLDVRTLALDRPHAGRHAFHREHRQELLVLWLVVLAINSILVATTLSATALRLVTLGSAGVIAYLVAVHLPAKSPSTESQKGGRLFFKEGIIGPLFSFGVFIPVLEFIHGLEGTISLAACWGVMLLAFLFTMNCLVVSAHDRQLDLRQGMRSAWARSTPAKSWFTLGMTGYLGLVAFSVLAGLVPTMFALTLAASAMVLTGVWRSLAPAGQDMGKDGANVWFDLAIMVSPLLAMLPAACPWLAGP